MNCITYVPNLFLCYQLKNTSTHSFKLNSRAGREFTVTSLIHYAMSEMEKNHLSASTLTTFKSILQRGLNDTNELNIYYVSIYI